MKINWHNHILVKLFTSQLVALVITFAMIKLGIIPPSALLISQGIFASFIGRLLRLHLFWVPLQILIPVSVVYSHFIPSVIYLAVFIIFLLVYWNSATEQVPLYLTNRKTCKEIGNIITSLRAKRVLDIGSGMGGVVIYLAKLKADIQAIGIETAPLVFILSKIHLAFVGCKNAEIIYKNMWDEDLSAYDVVYCFLSPTPMPKLFDKAKREMRVGTYFISNSFDVPKHKADKIVQLSDGRKTKLYIWKM